MKLGWWGIGLAVAVFAVAGTATATLLVYDGFNYNLGTDLSGQGSGTGWTGNWTKGDVNVSSTVTNDSVLDRVVTANNAAQVNSDMSFNGRWYYRQLGMSQNLTSGEFWFSWIYREVEVPNDTEFQRIWLDTDGQGSGIKFAMQPQFGVSPFGCALSTAAGWTTTGTNIQTTAKHLIVAKAELGVANGDAVMWVLRAPELSAITGSQVTEAALDASHYIKIARSDTPSLTISSNDYVVINVQGDGGVPDGNSRMVVDEIRIGTSAADVVPLHSTSLLMYEGFDYTLATDLVGQSGGTGWGGSTWEQQDVTEVDSLITNGLTMEGLQTDGNAVEVFRIDVDAPLYSGYCYKRRLGADPALEHETLWLSFLYRDRDGYSATEMQQVGIASNDFASGTWQGLAYPNYGHFMGGYPRVSSGGSTVDFGSTDDIMDGATYLWVQKQEQGTAHGETTAWILRESEWTNITASMVTEPDLDAHNYRTATLYDTPFFTVSTNNGLRLRVQDDGTAANMIIDEIRLGTAPYHVLPKMVHRGSLILVK